MQPKNVYIETYGCSANQAESQIMAGLLEKSGFIIINDEKQADIVIVNTCSVKHTTENKILHRLTSLQQNYPEKKLIVAGCLPEAELNIVKKIAKNAAIVGTNHIQKITIAADLILEDNFVEFVGKTETDRRTRGASSNLEKVGLPKLRENKVIDIVPIASGCVSQCSFCSTKLAKGDLFSYKAEHIVEEIKNAKIGGGAKEFWLTSQDCGCYGFDANTNVAALLGSITSIVSGTYFLRLGMVNPQHAKRILPQLIDAYRDEHVFKFLHIPVQSGSDAVLRKMQRGHSVEDYRNVVEAFRLVFPEITIWTDIIAGFPGETEEDFQMSVDLIKETRPDVVNISAYSPRPGTKAAKMEKLDTETVKDRTRRISLLAKEIFLEQNRKWLGWSGPVLVDEYNAEKQSFIGRNYAYKPVVIKNGNNNLELGQIIDVSIVEATSTYLIAKTVEEKTPEITPQLRTIF
jgi:MiaB-like tRNA modifying enzyme